MSGHSKWSKIKRQKQAKDVEKGALFSKLSRLITLSVIEGGGITDSELNVGLRLSVEKARQFNMPKETINRAIEKGVGPNKSQIKEVRYEAFAPYGVAMLIVATTDNPNRTINAVRNTVERFSGKLGEPGTVSYLFEHCGVLHLEKNKYSQESILQIAEKIGACDIEDEDNILALYFPFKSIGEVQSFINKEIAGVPEIDYRPISIVQLSNEHQLQIIKLIEALEDLEDVQSVYTNTIFTINQS